MWLYEVSENPPADGYDCRCCYAPSAVECFAEPAFAWNYACGAEKQKYDVW